MERADIDHDGSGEDERWRSVDEARTRAGLTVDQLWLRYFTFTGDAGPLEIEAFLTGLMPLSDPQHDILACAVNETLAELGLGGELPYAADRHQS